MEDRQENDQMVRSLIRGLESVVVAFSGGVDSSVVVALAREELGPERVLAVTATSPTYPEEELRAAREIAGKLGVEHRIVDSNELDHPEFAANPPERCYYCKRELFGRLWQVAEEEGLSAVADGANRDDQRDFRPGIRAADELGVRHPLMEAGVGKEGVRSLALRLGLESWDKPAMACLSSRFPYGETITLEKLEMVREAEDFLRERDFEQLRVRHHGPVARIEVPAEQIDAFLGEGLREEVVERLKRIGFTYVTVDLEGFRSGSMNEVLDLSGGDADAR